MLATKITVLTSVEFWASLKAEGSENHFEREWRDHLPLFDRICDLDPACCGKAIALREATPDRLPAVDSQPRAIQSGCH